MLINLLEEYPVIAIQEAHMLGQVKGAIVQDNTLVALSCTMENESGIRRFQVPISRIIMGSNAVMIQNNAAAHVLAANEQTIENKMRVFTPQGDLVGKVTAVHISRDRILKGIHTENGYLKIEEIKKIGNVIIADPNIGKENLDAIMEEPVEFLKPEPEEDHRQMEIPLTKEDIDERKPIIKMYEEIAEFVVNPKPITEPSVCEQEETYDVIQSKYKYLLGKKLINTVTIAEQNYPENSIINAELIESSLKYNCILTLIMNAED